MAKAMRRSRSGWFAKLSRPIVLRDGTTLATLADVRAFILKKPAHIQERNSWQRAACDRNPNVMCAHVDGGQ